jgi:NAD(P)-dependent dehydrogenase (short-subunit alcohol dehydrogenase family)/aryl carrier-like protein
VDLDPSGHDNNISLLLQELSIAGDEDQVAFRHGTRYVARLRRTTMGMPASGSSASFPLLLKPDATYLITGGLGDLGLKVADRMAARGARNIILMGRRSPSVEAKARIDEMHQAGTEAVVFQGDVSVRTDVERLVSMIEISMPPLRGVIHAAGTWKGGILLQQTWESMLEVLAPKVQGAWNLHDLTRSMPLDFFVSFSSGAAILGAAGLGDYAAANSFLDALAHSRRAEGLPGSSINWGPWADLGMVLDVTSVDTRRWSEHGMSFIPPNLALDALEAVIQQGTTQVSVLPIDWIQLQSGLPSLANSRFVRELVIGGAKLEKPPARKTLAAELLLTSDPLERQRILTATLQAEAARVLRLPVAKLEVNRHLNQLGMDSLMALELKNRMQAEWGMAVPLATILSGPPITELAAILLAKLDSHSAVADSASSSGSHIIASEEAQELLRKLPDLSDDDVDSILIRIMHNEGGPDGQR